MNIRNNYEYHGLLFSELPLIFHYDSVNGNNASKNWHQSIEILFFVKGKGIVECGLESFCVSPGRIAVINPNISHRVISDTSVEYYCLIPDNDFFSEIGINTSNAAYAPIVNDEKAAALFKKVIDAFSCIDVYKKASIITNTLELLLYLSKNHTVPETHEKNQKNSGISLAIGYMLANINKNLSLDELCEQAGMNKYYFIREFKKKTGSTPIKFIHINRCKIAKRMLASGNYSVSDVSEKTGFDSTSYFSKIFKRYVGKTPTEYLKAK